MLLAERTHEERAMSDLIVIGFDTEEEGLAALRTLRSLEKEAGLGLEDTAVISKDPDGKVHVKNEMASGTETGAVVGAVLGPMLAFMFPVVGIVGGAIVGGLVGRMVRPGIDGAFVKEVTDQIQPGTAAIFALVKSGSADSIAAGLRQYKGRIIQTTLTDEFEEALRDALKSHR
jgi:uncharacterized membrane protein